MAASSRRYFAGRGPALNVFDSDASDDDADKEAAKETAPAPTTVKPSTTPAAPQRRRRIVARVVSSSTSAPERLLASRGTDIGFVPVRPSVSKGAAAARGHIGARRGSASESSQSSDDVSASSGSASDGDDDADRTNGMGGASSACNNNTEYADSSGDENDSSLRPQFVQQNLSAIQKQHVDESLRTQHHEEKRRQLRHQEAQRLVTQVLREEENTRQTSADLLPDDADHLEDQDADYALWKVREILRICRDRDEQRAWEQRGTVLQATAATI